MNYIKIFSFMMLVIFFTSCEKDIINTNVPQKEDLQNSDLHRCNMQGHMHQLLQDPDYARKHQLKYEAVAAINLTRSACSQPEVLPVAIHFQGISSPDKPCLRNLAKTQIKVLNDDFQGTNGDISTWKGTISSSFPGISNGEACLEFCIADQNHPSGYSLNKGDLAITFNQTSGDYLRDWSGYINIIVRGGTGVLGYAPLGGSGDGDAVVIDADAFGTGSGCAGVRPQSPYVLGRTTTHEMGHYLFMDHIWGGGCGQDDGIADTPDSDDSYYGCPSVGVKTCGSKDLHMNYMDYTNDDCMYMFTNGQATNMEKYVASSLQNVVTKGKTVCSGKGGGGGGKKGVDALVNLIQYPKGNICASQITPIVVIKNNGPDVMTSVEIHYGLDSKLTEKKVWTGSLASGRTAKVTLKTLGVNSSNKSFVAETQKPNGKTDLQPSNDSKTQSINVDAGGNYILRIKPDDWGGDITWKLLDGNKKVVAKGGPYPDFDRTIQTKKFCLEDDCYTFKIFDSWGDGICCDYGRGFYDMKDASGNIIFKSNGRYGYRQTKKFCVQSGTFRMMSTDSDEKRQSSTLRVAR